MRDSATLLIHCPDRKGLVAAISSFLFAHGANILHADQHQDNELGLFFMRVEWSLADFDLADNDFRSEFSPIAARFEMRWRLEYTSRPQSVAIFVSRYQHCLADLLQRYQSRELPCRIPLILGNHPDARPLAEFYGIPFHHVPVEPGRKEEAERRQRVRAEPQAARGSRHAGPGSVRRREIRRGPATAPRLQNARSRGAKAARGTVRAPASQPAARAGRDQGETGAKAGVERAAPVR